MLNISWKVRLVFRCFNHFTAFWFRVHRAIELNQVIEDLFLQVQEKLVICTPYFNFPRTLRSKLAHLLEQGKA